MKKYVAGMGLLLAALMFFGCKQPTEPKLNKLSEHETIKVSKVWLDKDDSTLKSGFAFDKDKYKVDVYAARISGEAVSTLFSSAYYVGKTGDDGSIGAGNVKNVLGGAFAVGDNFVVGYRLVKMENGEIERSKVVAVTVEPAGKIYVDVTKATLKHVLKKWYVVAEVKGKYPTLKATCKLGGNDKVADIGVDPIKGVVTGSGDSAKTTFTWEIPVDKITKGQPMHAKFSFKDVEYEVVDSTSDKIVPLDNGKVLDPDAAANDDWEFKTTVLIKDNTEEQPNTKLLEASTEDAPVTVSGLMPAVKIANLVTSNIGATHKVEKIIYRYAFTESKDAPSATDKSWNSIETSADPVSLEPKSNLKYNKKYYLHVRCSYTVTEKVAGTAQENTVKKVSEDEFATMTTFGVPVFMTPDGLNAHYTMDTAKKTEIKDSPLANQYFLPGHKVQDVPAALATNANTTGSLLMLDNGKKVQSYPFASGYKEGDLSFKMRLSGKTIIENLLKGTIMSGINHGKKFKLINKKGKTFASLSSTNEEGVIELATFTAGDLDNADQGVKVMFKYYAPTFQSDNDDDTGAVAAKWQVSEQGKVKLIVKVNGVEKIAGTLFETSGAELNSENALNSVLPSAVVGNVKTMSFEAAKWLAYQDCSFNFTMNKLTVKVGAVSYAVDLQAAEHLDISEVGYKQFRLEADKVDFRVKDVTYKVTERE